MIICKVNLPVFVPREPHLWPFVFMVSFDLIRVESSLYSTLGLCLIFCFGSRCNVGVDTAGISPMRSVCLTLYCISNYITYLPLICFSGRLGARWTRQIGPAARSRKPWACWRGRGAVRHFLGWSEERCKECARAVSVGFWW